MKSETENVTKVIPNTESWLDCQMHTLVFVFCFISERIFFVNLHTRDYKIIHQNYDSL